LTVPSGLDLSDLKPFFVHGISHDGIVITGNGFYENFPSCGLEGWVAYLPIENTVDIDVKPGNTQNVINPRAKGGIWVGILFDTDSESTFDPSSQVDIPTVEFGPDGAKARRYKVKGINRDGIGDLLLRFKIQKTGIDCGDTEATLIGETFDGQSFSGTDTIKTVGCKVPTLIHDPSTGYVTSILGLDVNGDLYNATLHLDKQWVELASGSDPIWGNPALAMAAANAVMDALGDSERTHEGGDGFTIPTDSEPSSDAAPMLGVVSDIYNRLDVDVIGTGTLWCGPCEADVFVTFAVATHSDKYHNNKSGKACHNDSGQGEGKKKGKDSQKAKRKHTRSK